MYVCIIYACNLDYFVSINVRLKQYIHNSLYQYLVTSSTPIKLYSSAQGKVIVILLTRNSVMLS